MSRPFLVPIALLLLSIASVADAQISAAQTPPKEPPPLWDTQIGASFVGTSGNTDITSVGGDFGLHRRWPVWTFESTATVVRTTDHDVLTAERYLGTLRGQRKLSAIVGLTVGERAERDRFAGVDFRSILDGGLSWALLRDASTWTLDAVTAVAWDHEEPIGGPKFDDPIGVLQLLSRVPFGTGADSTQRVTFYPNFQHSDAYRSEVEVTAQAAMNARLALKIGFLWRYSNAPLFPFKKTDTTTTASIVVRFRSAELVATR